jgi:hypothetical protein
VEEARLLARQSAENLYRAKPAENLCSGHGHGLLPAAASARLSPPSHHRHHRPIGGVAQGKHRDGEAMRRLAGRPRALQISTAYSDVTRPEETLDTALRARERQDF